VLTDGEASVVDNLLLSIDINQKEDTPISARLLSWGPLAEDVIASFGPVDVIFAADCVYEPRAIPLLIATLAAFAKQNPAFEAHIVSSLRNPETYQLLRDTLHSYGFVYCEREIGDGKAILNPSFYHDYDVTMIRWLEVQLK
jgi:hypothetical protein